MRHSILSFFVLPFPFDNFFAKIAVWEKLEYNEVASNRNNHAERQANAQNNVEEL